MKISASDRDNIIATCKFNNADIEIKEKCIGRTRKYNASIIFINSSNEKNSIATELVYINGKITQLRKDKIYILIYEKPEYLIVSGEQLLERGLKYFRNLERENPKKFSSYKLSTFLKGEN